MRFNQRVKFAIIATIIVNIVFFSNLCFSEDRFIDNKNGTVSDNTTGLMWAKKIKHTNKEYQTMNYKKIMDYVRNYKTCGYDDWMVVEAFGRALPDLAAATRVWRDFFPSREGVYTEGLKFIQEQWQAAG